MKDKEKENDNFNRKIRNINWNNFDCRVDYKEKVIKDLRNVNLVNIWREGENVEDRVEMYYKEIRECFLNAHDEVIKERYSETNNKNKSNWWSRELQELKKKVKEAIEMARLWNNEESEVCFKKRKKEYRRCQRRSIFVFEEKKNKNIDKLLTNVNKDDFWKSIRSFKNGDNDQTKNEIEKKEIIKEIKGLFTMNNESIANDMEKMKIVDEVKKYENECRREYSKIEKDYLNNEMMKRIMKELKNSNTRRHDGMNNNMVKMISGNEVVVEKMKQFMFPFKHSQFKH